MASPGPTHSKSRRILAWGVHLFTASGAVIGTLALLAVSGGDYRAAALWMLAALAIDSVDGMAARRVGVSEVLPSIDGRRLDDIVDYFNYVVVPALFLLALGALPHWSAATPILLASAYGFSQREAKTEDAFFLGWPSYWNVVAIQAWLLETSPALTTAVVCCLAILIFVPLKYIHPSRVPRLWLVTNAGGALFVILTAVAVVSPERAAELHLIEVSLAYVVYYVGLSMWLGDWFALRVRT